uniref:Histone acetyltransferase n=1 Tax=Heliothis virescens TaxID=7102 RepID=A0A2A4J0U6_HELVI
MDMKIRKVRVLHQRKVRAEQTEKQQALALERMQRLVEESAANLRTSPQLHDDENQQTPEKPETPKKDKESSPHPESETDKQSEPSPYKDTQPTESDKELSPLKDLSNSMKNKELLNNNKDECSPADNSKIDKDSVMGDCDAILSDLESEGTQPEEDEDKNLSSEELARKLEKLLKQSEQQLLQLTAGSHALRATCYGQDRYWRRYWSLGKCGGIYVEAMESAQPEIMTYHQQLENNALAGNTPPDSGKKKKKGPREKKEPASEPEKRDPETEAQKKEEALKSEMELKSIKSELNLSDHTQIIKYEPNVKHGACKVEGSSIKMEEKYIQQKNNEEQDMLDIEDSIPTAFLVQKPTHKPMFAAQAEPMDKPQEIVKVENVVKSETEADDNEETKDTLVNNLEELRKMAEAVSIQLDAAKKEQEIKEEKEKVKQEPLDAAAAHLQLYAKILDGKWFSILRHESSFLNNINEIEKQDLPEFCDNEHTCSEVILCQGHKWDVSNNLHLLNDPSLFTLNSMVTSVQVPSNNIYADSSLTMSGLDQEIIDNSFNKDGSVQEMEAEEDNKEQDNDLEKELQADALKHDLLTQKAKANSLTSLGLLNFNALSTYVTCDSPPPIQMSAEEVEQLENCKVNGLPKKVEGNFVPRELRHGWWRITETDQLRELMDSLHPRGVRERELHASLTSHLPTVNNKLHIDKGDTLGTELCVSHLDRVIAQNGGFPSPDAEYSAHTQRRLDMQLLNMVEQLEERVAAASMQVKGWRPARSSAEGPAEPVARARHKLQALEAHIERRYLKPPLVQSTTEVTLGAVLQAEHGNASAPSPQNTDSSSEGKADSKGIARGLATWREAVARCNTSAQLAMLLQALEAAVAWDKSIMKANCQFCLSGDNEDQLLLCDGCDKGYHTYCFKPRMDKIPDGDWYCWECVNKARGERVCIVCGGATLGRTIPCALCSRAYHQDCHYPPLLKGLPPGLPLPAATEGNLITSYCWECGGATLGRTIPCALCSRAYHQDCHYPPLLKGLPPGLPLPAATEGNLITSYCWECGGATLGRTIPCALCSRAYHQDCHYPPLLKGLPPGLPLPAATEGNLITSYCWECGGATLGRTIPCALCSRAYHQDCHYPPLLKGLPPGLPLPAATEGNLITSYCWECGGATLGRTIPCALCSRAYHQDCHYPPLLKGLPPGLPLPAATEGNLITSYCWECGGATLGRTIPCALCSRAYHQDCHYPPLLKGLPPGLPLPAATEGNLITSYCWECGGATLGRTIPCALCSRAYHQDCHYPPLLKGLPPGLPLPAATEGNLITSYCWECGGATLGRTIPCALCSRAYHQDCHYPPLLKGLPPGLPLPAATEGNLITSYCWECGGATLGRTIPCALCSRAYHQDCHYPPLLKGLPPGLPLPAATEGNLITSYCWECGGATLGRTIPCALCSRAYHQDCHYPPLLKGLPPGLPLPAATEGNLITSYCWECGGATLGRTIPCALCSRAYHQDCHYPPLLKGLPPGLPLPAATEGNLITSYCWECGGATLGRTIPCALCSRAYHQDCHYPPLLKGLPPGLPLPAATEGNLITSYCWECGGATLGRTIPCALCSRAYHQDCHYPPLLKGLPPGLPLPAATEGNLITSYCWECGGATLGRTIPCALCSRAYHQDCHYPPLLKGLPPGLPLPAATEGNLITSYCWECGGATLGRTIPCALCSRAYHQDCHYPPLLKGLPPGLPLPAATEGNLITSYCWECGGATLGRTIPCALCSRAYHQDCHYPPLLKGLPPGLPLPAATEGNLITSYCWECGGATLGRTIPCALCSRAYHQDCHYPPLLKNPRGKWYCSQCISRAPPKKPRNTKKRDAKHRDLNTSLDIDQNMVPSPAASVASTSTTAEECSGSALPSDKHDDKLDAHDAENGLNHCTGELVSDEGPAEKRRALQYVAGNGALQHADTEPANDGEDRDTENVPLMSRAKKEKNSAKKLLKELQFCKSLLCEMECHEHAWPFLLPVNTKQFPQYKKVIKCPMDLSTIKRKLHDNIYKCKEEFASDVRLIFSNCEVFNEDDSPVGRAGHNMRQFFDDRWTQI